MSLKLSTVYYLAVNVYLFEYNGFSSLITGESNIKCLCCKFVLSNCEVMFDERLSLNQLSVDNTENLYNGNWTRRKPKKYSIVLMNL